MIPQFQPVPFPGQSLPRAFTGGDGIAPGTDLVASFQAILEQQRPGTRQSVDLSSPLAANEEAADIPAELAALFPFIDALGLTRAAPTETDAHALPESVDPSGLPAITAAVTVTVQQAPVTSSASQASPLRPVPAGVDIPTMPVATAFALASVDKPDFANPASAAQSAGSAGAQELPAAASFAPLLAATAQPATAQPAAAMPPSPMQPVVGAPVGSPTWGATVGDQVAWMVGHHQSRAELVLTPPDMGRMEVSVILKGEQATASFVSSNPVVREALEAALPQLREALAQAGIQLGQTQVSADNPRLAGQQHDNGQNSASNPERASLAHAASSPVDSGMSTATTGLKTGRGLVDTFA